MKKIKRNYYADGRKNRIKTTEKFLKELSVKEIATYIVQLEMDSEMVGQFNHFNIEKTK